MIPWLNPLLFIVASFFHFYFSYIEQGIKNLQLLNKTPKYLSNKGLKLFSLFLVSRILTSLAVIISFVSFFQYQSHNQITLFNSWNFFILLFFPVLLSLILTESAKLFSFSFPIKTSSVISLYLTVVLYYLFYPLILIIYWLFMILKNILSFQKFEQYFHVDWQFFNSHFLNLDKNIDDSITEEKRMIHSIYELSETTAKEIMVPRIDVIGFDIQEPVSEIIKLTEEHGHSRFPVYEDSLDHILGIVYIKDLFLKSSNEGGFHLSGILRPAIYVPETKKIDQLLKEFKTRKVHIAIVVDEYGGTAGIITLEDILEEIVGEIQDEFDEDEFIYQQLDKNAYIINGTINIDDLNEILNIQLPSEDYDTLGGFIYDLLGAVPHKDQRIEYENMIFFIDELQGQRISRVKVIFPELKEITPEE